MLSTQVWSPVSLVGFLVNLVLQLLLFHRESDSTSMCSSQLSIGAKWHLVSSTLLTAQCSVKEWKSLLQPQAQCGGWWSRQVVQGPARFPAGLWKFCNSLPNSIVRSPFKIVFRLQPWQRSPMYLCNLPRSQLVWCVASVSDYVWLNVAKCCMSWRNTLWRAHKIDK